MQDIYVVLDFLVATEEINKANFSNIFNPAFKTLFQHVYQCKN
jgi:hypothetical protein